MPARYPQRIVCLTEETTETLYLLGAQERIVGISGYTVRPPQARKQKPRISAFTSARIDKILDLQPDLVLGFSDLQADIARELIRHGINVHIFNQRSVQEILDMILLLGALVGVQEKATALVSDFEQHLAGIRKRAAQFACRPVVYFEEWDEPLISGIRWVAELVEVAGGRDCFPEFKTAAQAKDRVIADPLEVVRRQPDIIIGSWCGKKFRPEKVAVRPGWQDIPAVRNNHVYEVKSVDILQPGPAALTDGVSRLHDIISNWLQQNSGT